MECSVKVTIPAFAIVGAVNHGKSSVVSTLAEDDQVRVSAMPGETVECQRFELRDLVVFHDTPGFQNALEALTELAPAARAKEPLVVYREFIERHRSHAEFEAECRLLRPVVDGAGIIYVVDGSEPLLELHAAEMEILRLTGQPRLAVIQRTGVDDHVQEWSRRLGLHFNAVREFDAHHATFDDRVELLETLAAIEQEWKPNLTRAVALLREEWGTRISECAEIIVELLADVLTHREVAGMDARTESRRGELGEELRTRFIKAVRAREIRAHRAIIQLFRHNRVKADQEEGPVFDADLFSVDTWRMFGLDQRQLVTAGAVGGAAAGVGVDVLTAGHTLLAGALLGGVAGAAGAFVLGLRRPELKVNLPGFRWRFRLGGGAVSVGPYEAVNFPWILFDRAVGTFCYVINRAHARRDEATLLSSRVQAAMESAGVTCARWDEAQRRRCERLFATLRRGRMGPEDRQALRELIRSRLATIAEVRFAAAAF
jgi:predicted GTPase